MKLKSFGCSFIFGTDLHDDSRGLPKSTPSNFTWPALLAKHHNWKYVCCARPGSGNLEIAEKVLGQVALNESAIYVINWTWIDRFSYIKGFDRWWNSPWKTIMPGDTGQEAEFYYKNIHTELQDKLTTLINIKTVINSLKEHGHKFIMTYMDDLTFDQTYNTNPAILELQRYCKPYMTCFENKNFLEYSKEKGFEISQTLHPLEDAHQSAFELIKSYNLV